MTAKNQSRSRNLSGQSTRRENNEQAKPRGRQDMAKEVRSEGDGGPQRPIDAYDEEGLAMSRMTGHKSEQIPPEARDQEGDQRSDSRIINDIKALLKGHGKIDYSDIEVQVHDGIVTLAGTVTTEESKRQAEDMVKCVSRVRDVSNQIRIRREDQFPDNMVEP